ncbi:MAG: 50S ribosomal protein L11 methyltransferase, partial [Planctomycetota bacterium]
GGFHSARGQWPAVVANLVADLIQGGAGALADLVAPGGRLFAGGILDLSWEQTCTVLAGQGLSLDQSLSRGRWHAGVWSKT